MTKPKPKRTEDDQPLSLDGIDFEDAVSDLLAVKPDKSQVRKPKRSEPKPEKK